MDEDQGHDGIGMASPFRVRPIIKDALSISGVEQEDEEDEDVEVDDVDPEEEDDDDDGYDKIKRLIDQKQRK